MTGFDRIRALSILLKYRTVGASEQTVAFAGETTTWDIQELQRFEQTPVVWAKSIEWSGKHMCLGTDHLMGEGRKSEKNIEHAPNWWKKNRARQICKTNMKKLKNIVQSQPMRPEKKIEHFQKGTSPPHQKSNGPSLTYYWIQK